MSTIEADDTTSTGVSGAGCVGVGAGVTTAVTFEFNAANVFGPASPSTARPFDFWKSLTAFKVNCPKMPSTARLYPALLRFFCRNVTSLPVLPILSTAVGVVGFNTP